MILWKQVLEELYLQYLLPNNEDKVPATNCRGNAIKMVDFGRIGGEMEIYWQLWFLCARMPINAQG